MKRTNKLNLLICYYNNTIQNSFIMIFKTFLRQTTFNLNLLRFRSCFKYYYNNSIQNIFNFLKFHEANNSQFKPFMFPTLF